jgi:hypothetical protein
MTGLMMGAAQTLASCLTVSMVVVGAYVLVELLREWARGEIR